VTVTAADGATVAVAATASGAVADAATVADDVVADDVVTDAATVAVTDDVTATATAP
jgi:hypothetical protein